MSKTILSCVADRQEGVETRDEVQGQGPVDRPHLLPDQVRREGQETQWCGQMIVWGAEAHVNNFSKVLKFLQNDLNTEEESEKTFICHVMSLGKIPD